MNIRPPACAGALLACSFLLAACGDSVGPEPEQVTDPCEPAEIVLGASVSGSLSGASCQRGGNPVDRYVFDLAADTDVRIDLTSSSMDPYLELQTTSGTVIEANDDFGSLNSTIITRLDAGRYVIQARDLYGSTGAYQLSLREGPDCSPEGELEIGRTEQGSLTDDDCIWEAGTFGDHWSLTLTERMNLRIQAKSPDFDEVVLLRDAQGHIMEGADGAGPAGFAQFDAMVPAGTWSVTVGALTQGRTGAYELTVDLTPPCTPGTVLVLGQTESGSITSDDCRLDGYVPADSFALVLEQERPLDFLLKSSDMDPFLVVRDADGRDVVIADDRSSTGRARAQATLGPGTYAVYALSFDYPGTGSYQLTVSELACKDPLPIALGSSETGTLGDDDCLRANGAWQESWTLDLASEESVRIDMTSTAFDTYLILKDSLGNVIAEDDDGGDELNARIETTLVAGRYEIVATAFSSAQEGSYTLTVAAPAPPAAIEALHVPTSSVVGSAQKEAGGDLQAPRSWPPGPTSPLLRSVLESWKGTRH